MLIDTMEEHHLFPEAPAPGSTGGRQVIHFQQKTTK
jgi:hypothetical protein